MTNRTRRSKSRTPLPPVRPARQDPFAAPDLHELEKFTHRDLQRWQVASSRLDQLQRDLHFGLENQRLGSRPALLASLRARAATPFDFHDWVRIVDYRYCLEPLSSVGSLRGIGGRFNVGDDLKFAGFRSWPALYLAEDVETAYREKYQCPTRSTAEGLSPAELALQSGSGYLVAALRGRISSVLDIDDLDSLRPFCAVIGRFEMPRRVREFARSLKISQPQLIRSPQALQRALTSNRWRAIPTQFDIPATSQVFADLAKDAGYEAILYKSSRSVGRCMAIFPERLSESDAFVELTGEFPVEVELRRLDHETWRRFGAGT